MRVDVLHLSVMEKRKTSSSSTGNGVLSNYDEKNRSILIKPLRISTH